MQPIISLINKFAKNVNINDELAGKSQYLNAKMYQITEMIKSKDDLSAIQVKAHLAVVEKELNELILILE